MKLEKVHCLIIQNLQKCPFIESGGITLLKIMIYYKNIILRIVWAVKDLQKHITAERNTIHSPERKTETTSESNERARFKLTGQGP